MSNKIKNILLVLFFSCFEIFAQDKILTENQNELYKYLPFKSDSSTGQVIIFLDSLPENIFYPHTYSWNGEKWSLQIDIDQTIFSPEIKPAITKSGLLFFVNPKLEKSQFIIFKNGNWISSESLSSD